MSNIHGLYQNQPSIKKGKFNPYLNEGFAPISSPNSKSIDMSKVQIKQLFMFTVTKFSFWILLLQIITYIVSSIMFYNSEEQDWGCLLLGLGAKFEPKIKFQYEFYRLIAPIILHASLLHFLSNFISQLFLNFLLENEYGMRKFMSLFFLSGIGGNLMSCVMRPENISVGASSAIFGALAFYGCFLIQNYSQGNNTRMILIYVLILVGNFSVFFKENKLVDVEAHLGK